MNSAHMAAWTNHRPAKAAPGAYEGGSELPGHRPKAAMTFPEDHTGELDLADRHALRRVAGLSTELTDVTEVEYRTLRLDRPHPGHLRAACPQQGGQGAGGAGAAAVPAAAAARLG